MKKFGWDKCILGAVILIMFVAVIKTSLVYAITGAPRDSDRRCMSKTIYFDITGDGKKDKIQFIPSADEGGGYYGKIIVKVNDTKALTINDGFDYYEYQKITLKNNKKFLYIGVSGDDWTGSKTIYYYKNGRLYKAMDDAEYGADVVQSIKVKRNGIVITHETELLSVGMASVQSLYYSKGNKFKLKRKIQKIVEIPRQGTLITTNKSFRLYSDRECTKKRKMIPSGIKVNIIKCYISGNVMNSYIKCKKYKGWLKGEANDLWDYGSGTSKFKNTYGLA